MRGETGGLTFDDIIDALLVEFDRQWCRLKDLPSYRVDKPHELCHLENIRAASCLLLKAAAERRRPGNDDPACLDRGAVDVLSRRAG